MKDQLFSLALVHILIVFLYNSVVHWSFVIYLAMLCIIASIVGYFLALKMEQDDLMKLVMGLEKGDKGMMTAEPKKLHTEPH